LKSQRASTLSEKSERHSDLKEPPISSQHWSADVTKDTMACLLYLLHIKSQYMLYFKTTIADQ
jgi:hypothetical protein